jgi:hypothetical protein
VNWKGKGCRCKRRNLPYGQAVDKKMRVGRCSCRREGTGLLARGKGDARKGAAMADARVCICNKVGHGNAQ